MAVMHPCIIAARVPETIKPQEFGLWSITRAPTDPAHIRWIRFESLTMLRRLTSATMHNGGECVMEDSLRELLTHMPIFGRAKGRVLVTGLGLGCVVRGLLAKPEVEHIDVVELDRSILRVVGPEFASNPRVTLHQGDALEIKLEGRWDAAWHDLWTDGPIHLQRLHANLFIKFAPQCAWQGAWHFPGRLARLLPWNRKTA